MKRLSDIPRLKSADEILCGGDDWMELRRTPDDYTYAHEKKKIVAILLTRSDGDKSILGRFETVPPHKDGQKLVSLTGTAESGEHPRETAAREAKEESGYDLDPDEVIDLGEVYPSKGTDTAIRLFTSSVTGMEPGRADGDGTESEERARTDWVSEAEALSSKDPVLTALVVRWHKLTGRPMDKASQTHGRSARILPDTPSEKVYFREYDYSQPYFVEGTPAVFGEALPLRLVRYKGEAADPGDAVGLMSPVKDPESSHIPGVDNE